MKFSIYNTLSQLIVGFFAYVMSLYFLELPMDYLGALPATAIAYILGYFINTLGAWGESFLYVSWGGIPSNQLLENKQCGRIKFYETDKLKELLLKKSNKKKASNGKLFSVAMRVANNEGRIEEMNSQYVFSRSLFIALVFAIILLSFEYWELAVFWIGCVVILLFSWYRAKERGFYFAKEVLSVALNKLEEKE